jgi:hypothetical protein
MEDVQPNETRLGHRIPVVRSTRKPFRPLRASTITTPVSLHSSKRPPSSPPPPSGSLHYKRPKFKPAVAGPSSPLFNFQPPRVDVDVEHCRNRVPAYENSRETIQSSREQKIQVERRVSPYVHEIRDAIVCRAQEENTSLNTDNAGAP